MQLLSSLAAVLDGYDAILCDVWGVIHNGRKIYPGAATALSRARERGKIVILLTNVPKPRGPIPGQLDRIGFPRAAWDGIVTSGDAIRAELAKRAPGPMLKIGPAEDKPLWDGLGLTFSELQDARFIGISGPNKVDETPADYADLLNLAWARDLEMLCANPDIVVQWGDRLIWCAGAIARDYAHLGGRVVMAGKPSPPIYELAYRELEERAGKKLPRERILAIGDGLATDVRGANDQGLDCLFIAGGMHGDHLKTGNALDSAKVKASLAAERVSARYVLGELA
jgi:HAD superfamily hydrolase (TIGR01459 family)